MRTSDLEYSYPEELVAQSPSAAHRTLYIPAAAHEPFRELHHYEIIELFRPGDALVINQTQVENRRLFAGKNGDLEVLFARSLSELEWEVLFPARDLKVGDQVSMPEGYSFTLVAKGLPQKIRLSKKLPSDYFQRHAELALPPYIQKARQERHASPNDQNWYQTAWAKYPGSSAAPTASLHFGLSDLEALTARQVHVLPLTLHVGLGTFLPIKVQNLDQHQMHEEEFAIPAETVERLRKVKSQGGRIWALGTTVVRALETFAIAHGGVRQTSIFIRPGHKFQMVDRLLTNFHQPQSTLLALVMAFASTDRVRAAYQFAIENKFRLFSYGDLSIWEPAKDDHGN